ncbi:MAG TPA: biotin transporter BioY [Candidatus Dorea intestinavium]|nr:biotin transporter BioY [Candidatus Dorea intestinavium]
MKIKDLTLIALITALTCIFAPLSIPIIISPVPISLTNLVLLTGVYLIDWKSATFSYLAYLCLGLVGLPIFSGFSGGVSKLAGPTGGYLIGFLFMTMIAGIFVKNFRKNLPLLIVGMVLANLVNYIFGTLWLSLQLNLNFIAGLSIGVFPYLLGDLIKTILAMIMGPLLAKRLSPLK